MTSGSSITQRFPGYLATTPTLASLRNVSTNGFCEYDVIVVSGAVTAGDNSGGVYQWYPANLDADDGSATIKPNAAGPGRWKLLSRGAPGSDATVTDASVVSALGFTPADSAALTTLTATVTALSAEEAAAPNGIFAYSAVDGGYRQLVRDLDYHFYDPNTTANVANLPRIRPTDGATDSTTGLPINDQTTGGAYWQMVQYLRLMHGHWRVTGDPVTKAKIAAQWSYTKSIYTAAQLASDGNADGTITSMYDAAWKAQSLAMFHEVTGDQAALTALTSMISAVTVRFADPTAGMTVTNSNGPSYSKYGLITSSIIDHSSLIEMYFALTARYVYEHTGYATFNTYFLAMYNLYTSKLKKSDGTFYQELELSPSTVDSSGNSIYLKPVDSYFGAPQQGVSAQTLCGAMAMAVAAARLYRETGAASYLADANSIVAGLTSVYVQPNGLILNDRDAWSNGFFAPDFAIEVMTLPLTAGDALKAALLATASQIISTRTSDLFYSAEWSANTVPNAGGFTTWAQIAAASNTGNPAKMATAPQIMTSSTSGSMCQAGWVIDRLNRNLPIFASGL